MDLRTPEHTTTGQVNEAVIQQERRLIRDLITDDKFDEIGKLPGFSIVITTG